MTLIKPELTEDIKKYGSFDFSACYNCGNCTAVCNLSEANASFPRMMIRYSMLGLKDEILSSKELWMCYACGDCSDTCPREAGPGELMANLRRYSIAHYEKTGITRLIFKNNPVSILITLLLATVLGFFLLTIKPEMEVSRWIFKYLPYEVIHNTGLLAFAFMGLTAIIGVISMWIMISRNASGQTKSKTGILKRIYASVLYVLIEAGTMQRYQDCDSDSSIWNHKPFYLKPWFVHWSIMWGFIGLLLATALDFMLKDPATTIWWPSRVLGTLAGLLMMYGATIALWYRIKKVNKTYANSMLADWMFLIFLWVAGITGFWMEITVSINSPLFINQLIFAIHTLVSMELVILFAFSKFAHAFYRPLALFIHRFNS